MKIKKGRISVNGTKLYCQVSGHGAPLIMTHGNGETHEIFDRAIPLLSERFTVYAIDSRGHGKSEPVSEYHYEDMAADLRAFIRVMKLESPYFYGFSDDMVKRSHIKSIAAAIRGSRLIFLPFHGHGSYIVHREKIARLILQIWGR